MSTLSTEASTGSTSAEAVEDILAAAHNASSALAQTSPRQRAQALVAAAEALLAAQDALVDLAMSETGLSSVRLAGELKRTAVQLKLFAEVCRDGSFLDARIDEADPQFVLGPRPDLRRYRAAVGPVLVYAASNFPFAFSVAGGDTAAALAAGCAVIVKAHAGHPRLSLATADVVRAGLQKAGVPAASLQVINGREGGLTALRDNRIKAASFTGSIPGGLALASVAAERKQPIPFYGELGSVNPVVVTPAALAERGEAIAAGFITSVTGSAGQLCTKPGFLFLPQGHGLDEQLIQGAGKVDAHRLLTDSTANGYAERRSAILQTSPVQVLVEGEVSSSADGPAAATPTLVSVTLDDLRTHQDTLLEEAFGPLSILVTYTPDQTHELTDLIAEAFPGNLTATVHLGSGEDSPWVRELVDVMEQRVGRVLFNGWPTGVAVTPAMQHGGPFPASTVASTTSVGTAAVERFQRAVTFQDCPQELLPPALRDDNPWQIPQAVSAAGLSGSWGQEPA